jgi:hypothetical protein
MNLRFALCIVVASALACSKPSSETTPEPVGTSASAAASASASAPASASAYAFKPIPNAPAIARDEFQILPRSNGAGTSKLYSRRDFLPVDDPRAFDEGDFIGRLRALFGPAEGDEYVLRHRATGFVITAYSAQSGPSYGGGPRLSADARVLEGGAPPPQTKASFETLTRESKERRARVEADPVLKKGTPVDWGKIDVAALSPAELRALREKELAFSRHFGDVASPPGFPPAVVRLDELVNGVAPADFEETRYYGDDPSVIRFGARGGASFSETLPPDKGLDFLLERSEAKDRPKETALPSDSPDQNVVDYAVRMKRHGDALDSRRARVEAAWFRLVSRAKSYDGDIRDLVLKSAAGAAPVLGIDPVKADAAVRESGEADSRDH